MPARIAVLMACHNRREGTLSSLRALREAVSTASVTVFLVDDGSTDGTSEAVLAEFPEVVIQRGDGNLYWAASMALAERIAMREPPDFLLWLNDDTILDPGAVDRMLDLSAVHPGAIIVGATRDPRDGLVTYGGRLRIDRHPQRFRLLPGSAEVQIADNFNGNCVLIPAAARLLIGPIDGHFSHAFADDDYGQRAKTLRVGILVAPGTIGTCAQNVASLPPSGFAARWRHYEGAKGLPWRAQFRYLKRHGDATWPVWFAGSFAKRMAGWHSR